VWNILIRTLAFIIGKNYTLLLLLLEHFIVLLLLMHLNVLLSLFTFLGYL